MLLFDGDSTIFGIGISSIGQNTNDLFFVQNNGTQNQTVSSNDSLSISFRLYADSSSYLEYIYTLSDNAYDLKFQIKTVEFEQYISNQYITLNWDTYIRSSEKGKTWENDNSTIHYQYLDDEHDYINSHSKDEENVKLTGRVKWVAFKHHFFSSIIIADEHFLRGGAITSTPLPLSENHVKRFSAVLDLPYEKNKPQNLKFYFGPNHYPTLKGYDLGLEQLLDLGWGIFAWLNKFAVIPIFNWLSKYFVNFGLIIFLLTVIIKLVLFPLTYKSYLSTAKMRVLKPEVDKLNEKFDKSEALKKQQSVMELYRKAGVNPMGGCIPMLIQLPILYAMFRFFPASIELRQESFLWAEDLSTYDSIMTLPFEIPWYGSHVSLFTLLMAVSMIFTTVLSNKNMTTMPGQPNMKFMMWMMPIMMLFWFNSYSSGLSYYYFVANMITLIQTWIIKATIDDEALLNKLKANTKIPKKKSKFQQKLEDIQKQQKSLKK
ncbi:MAG: membrane protein insertase YidC [Bacteroidales bacterium]|nr:membrane protein insertase YidC [Bacteroidales bacterium]